MWEIIKSSNIDLQSLITKIYKLDDKIPEQKDFNNTLKTPSGEPEVGSGNFTVKK